MQTDQKYLVIKMADVGAAVESGAVAPGQFLVFKDVLSALSKLRPPVPLSSVEAVALINSFAQACAFGDEKNRIKFGDQLVAALTQPTQARWVPTEPTEDMLFAAEISKPRGYRDLWAAMLAASPQAPVPELDVRKILLGIVPGDGNGLEVYAKSVEDVERKLSEMWQRIEDLEGMTQSPTQPQPSIEVLREELAQLGYTFERGLMFPPQNSPELDALADSVLKKGIKK